MKSRHRYAIFFALFLMMGGVIGTQAWLSLAFVQKQRVALLNDVNHTVAEAGAAQLNATFLLAAETARAKALGALFGTSQGLHPVAHASNDSHILGLQIFRKDGEIFLEEKLSSDVTSLGYNTEVIGAFLSLAEKNQHAYWQAAKPGGPIRYFLSTRIDAATADHPVVYIAVAEIDPQLLLDHLQAANLFGTYLITRNGQILFHLGATGNQITPDEVTSIGDLMRGRGPASSGLVSYHANGQEWYGAVAPVGASDFYILSRAGSTEIGVETSPLMQIALALGAIALLASLLFSLVFKMIANRFLATYAGIDDRSFSAPAPAEGHVPSHKTPASHPSDPPEEETTHPGFQLDQTEKTPKPLVEEDEDMRRVDE